MKLSFKVLFLLILTTVPAVCQGAPTAPAADHFFTTSDGVTLHYLEAGQGPSLVFIPGWTMSTDIWAAQTAFFSTHYRVVVLDPRCQGKSQITTQGLTVLRRAQDIQELLDQLKALKPVLVGWSMGGSETLAYLGQFGSSGLTGVVLVDAPPGSDPTKAQILKRQELIKRLQDDRGKETNSFVRWMFHKPQSENFLTHLMMEALRTPTPAAVALIQDLYSPSNWRPDYSKIDLPVLGFASESYAAEEEWLQTKIKGMKVEMEPGAGHALFVDEAGHFNKQTQKFLDHIGYPGNPKGAK